MERWYRIFGGGQPCDPETLITSLLAAGFEATAAIHSDAAGWFQAEFTFTNGPTLIVDRYRCDEDGIRAELNSWAAWIETRGDNPLHVRLMERLIQTAQLFTLVAETDDADRLCECLSRILAAMTGGIYQIDGRGLFDAEGTLLVAEEWG